MQERPDPEPGPGEVRVRVRAAGINFADLMARVGLYPDAPSPPCVVGYEFAGEVESLGEGVEGVEPGQRVMGGCRFGGYAELAVTGASEVVPLPDGWSFAEGAALTGRLHDRVRRRSSATAACAPASGCSIHVGGRRRGHRRHPDREAHRGRGLRHGVAAQARRHPRLRRRPPGRLPHARRGGRGPPHDGRAASRSTSCSTRSAGAASSRASRCFGPGGRLVCFGASEIQAGERRSRRPRAARARADAALQPAQADATVEVGDRPQHARALGREAARSTSTSRR